MVHIQVSLGSPVCCCYMAQPGTDQHQSALAIWKSSNRLCTALDFPIDSFRGIVGSDSIPVFARIVHICKGFFDAFFHFRS